MNGQTMTIGYGRLEEALRRRTAKECRADGECLPWRGECAGVGVRVRLSRFFRELRDWFTVENFSALVAAVAFGVGVAFAVFCVTVAAEKLLDFIHGEKNLQNSSFSPLRNGGENATMCAKSRTVHSRAFLCPAPSRGFPRAPISGGVFYPWCGTFFDFNAEASESATAS